MFVKRGDFYTNREEGFLNKSDLILFYNYPAKKLTKNYVVLGGKEKYSKVDIPKTSERLPLLLARLAYVFEIYDENLKKEEEFEDFVEIVLKSVRVKKEILNHQTTLEEVAGLLYLMDKAEKISVFLGDAEEGEIESLLSFLKMFEKKVGVFSKKDISSYEFEFYGI
jgi:hypothetical protein